MVLGVFVVCLVTSCLIFLHGFLVYIIINIFLTLLICLVFIQVFKLTFDYSCVFHCSSTNVLWELMLYVNEEYLLCQRIRIYGYTFLIIRWKVFKGYYKTFFFRVWLSVFILILRLFPCKHGVCKYISFSHIFL